MMGSVAEQAGPDQVDSLSRSRLGALLDSACRYDGARLPAGWLAGAGALPEQAQQLSASLAAQRSEQVLAGLLG